MEQLIWFFKTESTFTIFYPIIFGFVFGFLAYNLDIIILLFTRACKGIVRGDGSFNKFTPGEKERPSALVIIPSLLRDEDDYNSFLTAIKSITQNGYPGQITVIASVDGSNEDPKLYKDLSEWIGNYNDHPDNMKLFVCHTEIRRGKVMAIDHALLFMKSMVADGVYSEFPTLYFSMDADSTLSEHALERLASRITTPHHITGNLRRVVAGQACVHQHEFWQGWRKFFTIQGQIYLCSARQYLFYGMYRYNVNPLPFVSLPGVLYCTWSHALLQTPYYMGYLQTITYMHWIKWWFGIQPPAFDMTKITPCPQALAGQTDDTAIAICLSIMSWRNGKLVFDPPKTPLHAFGRMMWAMFIERAIDYDPDAKVYTYTPPTIKSLWLQRVRWNSCRVEAEIRYNKAFLFNWNVAFPYLFQIIKVVICVLFAVVSFVIVPFLIFGRVNIFGMALIGYLISLFTATLYTILALILDSERKKFWRMILSIPFDIVYSFVFGFAAAAYGIINDIFLYGQNSKFVPQDTLISGRSQRIAIAYRVRRFLSMCVRSVRYGDVPFGSWWFGWKEYEPYVKSGYNNWTSGKNSKYILK